MATDLQYIGWGAAGGLAARLADRAWRGEFDDSWMGLVTTALGVLVGMAAVELVNPSNQPATPTLPTSTSG